MKEEAVSYITAECLKGSIINLRQIFIKPHYYIMKIGYSSNSNFLCLNCGVWGNNISILNFVQKVIRNSVGEALVSNQKSFFYSVPVCLYIYIYFLIVDKNIKVVNQQDQWIVWEMWDKSAL